MSTVELTAYKPSKAEARLIAASKILTSFSTVVT